MILSGKVIVAVVLAGALGPFAGTAYRRTEEGNRLYVEKAYEDALRAYTEAQVELPEEPTLFYDIGNVLYRQGDLAGAEEAWTRATAGADPELLADISHNLGNARYQRQAYQEAVEAYSQALRERPDDRDTKRNLELALRQLQAQQQQQQQDNDRSEDEEESEQDKSEGQPQPDPEEKPSEKKDQPPEPKDGKGEEQEQQRPEGGMSREEAERLLDSLEAQEKDNLKEAEAARKAAAGKGREKDW